MRTILYLKLFSSSRSTDKTWWDWRIKKFPRSLTRVDRSSRSLSSQTSCSSTWSKSKISSKIQSKKLFVSQNNHNLFHFSACPALWWRRWWTTRFLICNGWEKKLMESETSPQITNKSDMRYKKEGRRNSLEVSVLSNCVLDERVINQVLWGFQVWMPAI